MNPIASPPGMLVLVVGPSGAGKDSLLRFAAAALVDEPRIGFPRRVITRPCRDDVEAHDSMSPAAFAAAKRDGRFVLDWEAHGLNYGIPVAIVADLERGRTIVINVSRHILAQACARFSPVTIIHVTAPPQLLLERLGVRGREDARAVEARIARRAPDFPAGAAVVTIANAGPIEAAREGFTRALVQCGKG